MAYTYDFPRPAVTVDIVAFARSDEERHVLLIRRGAPPFEGQWALPGGFVEIDEELPDAARRELEEETGLAVESLRQLGAYGALGRDPRGRTISVVYLADLPEVCDVVGLDDAAEARWFPVEALPDLAFDHAQIISDALAGVR